MKQVIFLTGHKGFIGGALFKKLTGPISSEQYHIITYDKEIQDLTPDILKEISAPYTPKEITSVWHFASPSEVDQFDHTLYTRALRATLHLIELFEPMNCSMVFASSVASHQANNGNSPRDHYARIKRVLSDCIFTLDKSTLILDIPRVYSATRTKGLMRKFKEGINRSELGNNVIWTELDTFIDYTLAQINKFDNPNNPSGSNGLSKIINYNEITQMNTLMEVASQLELSVQIK